jgi:hypothetical protein
MSTKLFELLAVISSLSITPSGVGVAGQRLGSGLNPEGM